MLYQLSYTPSDPSISKANAPESARPAGALQKPIAAGSVV
jgi:hypothetical protein